MGDKSALFCYNLYMIDAELRKYFWDVNPTKLDSGVHKTYIIERILDMGDEPAVAWLRRTYSKEDILKVAEKSRRLSAKSKNFWKLASQSL